MIIKRTHTLNAMTLACLAMCQSTSWGGSASGEFELPGVTVTGSSSNSGTVPRNLPANSAGFSAKEISEQVNVINTDDIVKYSPDTMTRKRYVGDRNGIVETRTSDVTSSARSLIYFDGVLLSNLLGNNYNFPPRWGMVSAEGIKRVDFFFGPYSAAFAGNSIGTTVLMTSRSPEKFEASGKVQSFSESFDQYGHAANNTGGGLSASVGNKAGPLSWLLTFNHLDSTGHPMSYVALDSTQTSTIGGSTVAKGALINSLQTTRDFDQAMAARTIVGSTSREKTSQDTINAKFTFDITSTLKAQYMVGSWSNKSHNYSESYLLNASGQGVTRGGAGNGVDFYVNDGTINYKVKANAFNENVWTQQHWLNALSLKSNTRGEFDWEAVLSSYRIEDTQHVSQPDGKCGIGSLTAASGDLRGACGGGGQATAYFGTVVNNPQGDGWKTFDWRGSWKPSQHPEHDVAFGYHWDQYSIDTSTYFTSAATGDSSWETASSTGALSSGSKGSTRTDALYLQDAWWFSPDWKLTSGLRAEQWQAFEGRNSQFVTLTTVGPATRTNALSTVDYANREAKRFSPKLAIDYTVNEDWLLRASLGRAFRFPTVSEMFQPVATSTSLTINNPDLKPENATSMEWTAERTLASGLLRMSFFTEYVKDAIYKQKSTVDGVSTSAFTNVDGVRTRGLTLAYQQANAWVKGLDLMGSVTYADPRTLKDTVAQQANPSVDYAGKVFPGVPQWRATAVATYHPSDKLAYTLAGRYSGRQRNTLENTDTNTDIYSANSSYLVFDVRATWQVCDGLRLGLGIDNLNNEKYYAYHPMPQRTVHFDLKANF